MTSRVGRQAMAPMERHILNGSVMMAASKRPDGTQRGFTFVGVLVVMTVMLIAMGAASQIWHTVMQRENEQELLFIGHQFRTAIGRYYVQTGNQFPPSLEALLESTDPGAKKVHFLRKLYRDPMTGTSKWGLILGPDARIAGVYSLSDEKPYKISDFVDADAKFEGAEKYSDWKFVYVPKVIVLRRGGVVNGVVRPVPRVK